MTYVDPAFYFHHALRSAGASGLSVSTGTLETTQPKERLLDGRNESKAKFDAAAVNHAFDIDRGSGTLTPIDTLIVPNGHNMSGDTFKLEADDEDTFTAPTLLVTATWDAGQTIQAFSRTALRFIRLTFVTSGQQELGELFLTQKRVLTLGQRPVWEAPLSTNVAETVLDGGETFRLQRGPSRRLYELEWLRINDAADQAIFADLESETVSGIHPFYFRAPDSNDGTLWVALDSDVRRRQASPNPAATGVEYTYRLRLAASIG